MIKLDFSKVVRPLFRRYRRQEGVLIAALAVIILPIMIIFVGLGVDAVRAKYARIELEKMVADACQAAASELPFQKRAFEQFHHSIQDSISGPDTTKYIHYLTLTGATLYLPTQSSVASMTPPVWNPYATRGLGAYPNSKACVTGAGPTPSAPFCGGSACSTASVDFHAIDNTRQCTLPGGVDCQYYWRICDNEGTGETANTPGLWSPYEDAGSTVGCEASASYRSVLGNLMKVAKKIVPSLDDLTNVPVRARVVWGISPLPSTEYSPSVPVSFDGTLTANIPSRPLSIVIAPELRTDALDPNSLFLFDAASPPAPPNLDNIRYAFDPLALNISSTDAFGAASGAVGPPPVQPADVTCPTYCPTVQNSMAPGSPEWNDAAVACMNPLILARNALASALLEVTARMGTYRYSTEILVVNPKNENPSAPNNPPVSVMKFKQDPFKAQYQIPYVYFQSQSLFSDSPAYNGWPYPWHNQHSAGTDVERYESGMVSQLRNCFHLYKTAWNDSDWSSAPPTLAQSSLRRYFAPYASTSTSTPQEDDNAVVNNQGFEDSAFIRNVGLFYGSSANPSRWEQESAWGSGPQNDMLTAPELLSILGSVQQCPYSTIKPGGGCSKTGTELTPDFIGLFEYFFPKTAALDLTPSPTPPETGGFAGSYNSPGMWFPASPPSSTSNPQADTPTLHLTENDLSTIVIITHKSPSMADAQIINSIVDCSRRPIFVVLMPSPADEAVGANSAVSTWRTALGVDNTPTCTDLTSERIHQLRWIYYISPQSPNPNWREATANPDTDTDDIRWYGDGHWNPKSPGPPNDHTGHYSGFDVADYRKLWFDLLNDTIASSDSSRKHGIYAPNIAKTIATGNLVVGGPKY